MCTDVSRLSNLCTPSTHSVRYKGYHWSRFAMARNTKRGWLVERERNSQRYLSCDDTSLSGSCQISSCDHITSDFRSLWDSVSLRVARVIVRRTLFLTERSLKARRTARPVHHESALWCGLVEDLTSTWSGPSYNPRVWLQRGGLESSGTASRRILRN